VTCPTPRLTLPSNCYEIVTPRGILSPERFASGAHSITPTFSLYWGPATTPPMDTFWALFRPFMENGNSLEYIQQHPGHDRTALLSQVADALTYLHCPTATKCALVHGDLKGENVLISADGYALLADFGFSNSLNSTGGIREPERQTRVPGTIRFQAPELLFHQPVPHKTPQSDVWAFGMLIYQIYSGRVPFHKLNDGSFYVALHMRKRPTKPRGCPPAVWAIAKACFAEDPAGRPTMEVVRDRLRQLRISGTECARLCSAHFRSALARLLGQHTPRGRPRFSGQLQ